MISGRGLGHTGGTLDKLESIPGFRTALSIPEYKSVIRKVGAVLIGQTNEIVPADTEPPMGKVRDVNSHTLAAMIKDAGAVPIPLGIVGDSMSEIMGACRAALDAGADMLLVSGGSSVGARDLTIEVLSALPEAEILLHGIAIKPGKPTILARVGQGKPVWGLPGHVASAMVVFHVLVRRFIERLSGLSPEIRSMKWPVSARLSRNAVHV